jgi:hypothetical protein
VDTDGEGELLAGHGAHECLEDAGKARRSHAEEAPREGPETVVAGGQLVEAGEVDPEPEHTLQGAANFAGRLHARGPTSPAYLDGETDVPRLVTGLFGDADEEWARAEHQRPRALPAVPRVNGIVWPAPKRPDGEVQAER